MGDILGLDPARIERLRDPARLETLHPDEIWQVLPPVEAGAIVDIGAGVGYLALPFARRFPRARVYGCDILAGMLELLGEAAREEGLDNLETVLMEETRVPLPDGLADLVTMAQVHHELNDPPALLADCHRLLKPGGRLAIIDWKGAETGKGPPRERRVPEATIQAQLAAAGFREVAAHERFPHHSFHTALR